MIEVLQVAKRMASVDGTVKFLFDLEDGGQVESVLIPDVGKKAGKRAVCISSQVGCAMGCTFCLTGQAGLTRGLTPPEIVGQVEQIAQLEEVAITHVVFMGMGEPLHNLEAVIEAIRALSASTGMNIPQSKITVSTAGLLPQLERLAKETNVKLALTLSATRNITRNTIMPINKRYPIEEIIACFKRLPLKKHREIFVEYVLLDHENDSEEEARELADMLAGIPCKVNLIPWNAVPGTPHQPTNQDRMLRFLSALKEKRVAVSVRQARGQDILAACGQLTT